MKNNCMQPVLCLFVLTVLKITCANYTDKLIFITSSNIPVMSNGAFNNAYNIIYSNTEASANAKTGQDFGLSKKVLRSSFGLIRFNLYFIALNCS